MRFRIQPRDIAVPDLDPFQNDLLNRKGPAEVLTHIIESIEGPCVVAIDAGWGTGKTTFLRMWAQHLRNQEFPVVEFNAWETDFSGDPFIALSTELTDGFPGPKDETLEARIARTKKLAKEIAKRSLPGAIRVATAGILDLGPLIEKEVAQALSSYAEDRMSDYQKARKAIAEFRESLQELSNTLKSRNEHRPLVVVIDELDRCRPSYAVELLEAAKHLFAVPGVVFVLALNRSELAHSVKTLYGGEFDAVSYLRRFFDVDFRLPDPDRTAFIDGSLNAARIPDYFKRMSNSTARDGGGEQFVRDCLEAFFGSPDLGLRSVSKAIHHLGLVYTSLATDQRPFAESAVVALVLRTVDPELYSSLMRGEVTDCEVVDRVFDRNPGLQKLRKKFDGVRFEVLVMFAYHEFSGDSTGTVESPLLQRYRQLAGDEASDVSAKQHAQEVVEFYERLRQSTYYGHAGPPDRFGFSYTVGRLELLSPDLIGGSTR